jgi:tRNA-specific adenosine deaminase 1
MKCLPQNRIAQAHGITLHDWHAEILAIRSFNRFLLDECHSLASGQKEASDFVRLRRPSEITKTHFQPFALNDDITLHMYCSEAPCRSYLIHIDFKEQPNDLLGGDASMELTMAAQDDATPWDLPPVATSLDSSVKPNVSSPPDPSMLGTQAIYSAADSQLHGRGYFSVLGVVRRKPSRPDAPPTLSKSCSDKIALKECTSLLSSITSLLISPSNAYLSSLVLPESQYSQVGCTRAFSPNGRMKGVVGKGWGDGYAFNAFQIRTTSREFAFSRRQDISMGNKLVPSNISASWTPYHMETLIGGVLQGRKQGDIRGASRTCKRRMWEVALEISELVKATQVENCLKKAMYTDVKLDPLLAEREEAKQFARQEVLDGWVRDTGDERFSIQAEGTK